MADLRINRLKSILKAFGVELAGIYQGSDLKFAKTQLEWWQRQGFAGEMQYMKRSSDLLCRPQLLLPELKSILVCAFRYEHTSQPPRRKGFGNVARYAWGLDYHEVLKEKLELIASALEQDLVDKKFIYRTFSDAVPLVERSIALEAGIGFIGKNSMLITPSVGSYYFLAEILTNLELSLALRMHPVISKTQSCGSCKSCKSECPTGAIVDDKMLDARKCISYLTIEKRGVLTNVERSAIGDWVFGCDICQEVCPFNHAAHKEVTNYSLECFQAEAGCGPQLKLNQVLAIRTKEQFMDLFRRSPIRRAKREGLLRNAACVAANQQDIESVESLAFAALHDNLPIIRLHAIWALAEMTKQVPGLPLTLTKKIDAVRQNAIKDPDSRVRSEASLL